MFVVAIDACPTDPRGSAAELVRLDPSERLRRSVAGCDLSRVQRTHLPMSRRARGSCTGGAGVVIAGRVVEPAVSRLGQGEAPSVSPTAGSGSSS